MEDYILTADAGGTKTAWRMDGPGGVISRATTAGINPFLMESDDVIHLIGKELLAVPGFDHADIIRFYGAGCRGRQCDRMTAALRAIWPAANITVGSDIVGAAHALLGEDGSGIACILGTGSNSCLWVGGQVVSNIPPLGYVLGDEGSGAVLGRRLVGDVLKHQLPDRLCEDFWAYCGLSSEEMIERVYRQPMPNRFLASFAPFLSCRLEKEEQLCQLVDEEFARFFVRNVEPYHRVDLPVSFVGGVAWAFRSELKRVADSMGYQVGRIMRSPLD